MRSAHSTKAGPAAVASTLPPTASGSPEAKAPLTCSNTSVPLAPSESEVTSALAPEVRPVTV